MRTASSSKLVQRGYPATKVSSTGGFLRRGNATIFSGVDADDVDNVIAIIRSECKARTEFVPAQALPFPESIYPAEPVQVRVGGAIVFVVRWSASRGRKGRLPLYVGPASAPPDDHRRRRISRRRYTVRLVENLLFAQNDRSR